MLVREFARRTGRGWPTILLLCAAAGLVQAGVIDQSLSNHDVFDGSTYWQSLTTRIPGVDVDASQLLVFVGGHVIWSFGAPIAVVEACVPRLADQPSPTARYVSSAVALAALLGLLAWARRRLRVARTDTDFLQRNGTDRGSAIEL